MTKEELDGLLTAINYYRNFQENFLNKNYGLVDYGSRLGKMKFNSFFDASEKYTYSNEVEKSIFSNWNEVLNNETSTEEDLMVACLEIFDWGNVLSGNVRSVINLYKNQKIKSYVNWVKSELKSKSTLTDNSLVSCPLDKVIWSSGWTKVYSFINNEILIYDSRVSAFLNYTLISSYPNSDDLNNLTKLLFNFKGAQGRKRQVDLKFGFKNQHPKGSKGFNANLISSWIVQLLNEKLGLNRPIRDFERAFFMLGFDLNQIME